MFSDFIKHYDNIRGILRNIFLYGCFSREALENKSVVSSRKISYEIRRIQQYLQDEFIKIDKDGRNKLLNLSYNPINNSKNFLVNTYYSKSFTRADVTLYFYINLLLSNKGELSLNEIENLLVEKELINLDGISTKTIERKLKEMEKEIGIISSRKIGRTNYYKISDDILKNFTVNELERLFYGVSLYKNIQIPVVAGHFTEETLKNYIRFEWKEEIEVKDAFQYNNLHFQTVIEEELLWDLGQAIKNKNYIKYDTTNIRRYRDKQEELIPYKIRYDVRYGRVYLSAFDKEKRCINARLDRVKKLKIIKRKHNESDLKELYDKAMENSWSAVPIRGNSKAEEVVFLVEIDSLTEWYILEKIKYELKEYRLESFQEKYKISMYVNDPTEMIPWFREYGEYVNVEKPIWLKKRLKKDWKEVLKNYGVI